MSAIGGAAAPGSDQAANSIFAGPVSGGASAAQFRAQVIADLPAAIPPANLLNDGDNALRALQLLGTNFKGSSIGNAFPNTGGTISLANARIYWGCIYVPQAFTATGVSFLQAGTGVYTSTGYNGIGLYSINTATGLLTQIAATTSSTTAWAGAVGLVSVNFAATVALTEGVYYIACLYGNSAQTTAPFVLGLSSGGAVYSFGLPHSMAVVARLAGQSALPATQAFSGLAAEVVMLYTWLF